jgi:hypothetical protein
MIAYVISNLQFVSAEVGGTLNNATRPYRCGDLPVASGA